MQQAYGARELYVVRADQQTLAAYAAKVRKAVLGGNATAVDDEVAAKIAVRTRLPFLAETDGRACGDTGLAQEAQRRRGGHVGLVRKVERLREAASQIGF